MSGTGLRLGVDVGGTFTDLLLLDQKNGRTYTAKVPSTPKDSSIGVLNGIEKICRTAGIDPTDIADVMHGTTVATNTVLTLSGALVGLVTTKGYRDTLQIARSFVPGGLGGWVIWNKTAPLAPLEYTIEANERMDAKGNVLVALDEDAIRADLQDAARIRHRGADDRAVQQLRQRRARAPHRRDRPGDRAAHPGLDLGGRDAGNVGVRAHRNDGRQFLRPPRRVEIRRQPAGRDQPAHGRRGAAAHPALRRRPVLGAVGDGPAGQPADVRPGRRRLRRAVDRQAGQLQEHPDLRHGRHLDRRRADPELDRTHPSRDPRRRRHRARPVGRRAHGRRRRRLDRLRAGTDQGAARRPAVGRRRSRDRRPTGRAANCRP